MNKERFLNTLFSPHISEKASFLTEKHNVVVFNVDKRSTKLDIKCAIKEFFSVDVNNVWTLNIKKKNKKGVKHIKRNKFWKKAYVALESGQKIDFFSKINKFKS